MAHSNDFDSGHLSLEQQKQIEVENNRKAEVEARKLKIIEMFTNLREEFQGIRMENEKLPEKFRLSEDCFDVDSRITDDLERKANLDFENMQSEMHEKINRLKQHTDRIDNAFLSNIEHWPTVLTGFR